MIEWAKKELDLLFASCEDEQSYSMQQAINKDILQIVKVFSKQGHSGFSAGYALSIINRLLHWKPIKPLTGEDSEWNEVGAGLDNTEQNNRCSSVFRINHDNSTAYDIDGKVFSDDGGQSWYTNRDSRVPVVFPYAVPEKPEYIILREGSENKDEIY